MLVDLMGRCGPDPLLVDRRPDGAELTVRSATALRRSGASAVAERDSRGDGLPGGGLEFSDFCTAYRPSLVALGGANGLVAAYVGFPQLLTGAYARLFRWIVQPVRRRQELEADAAAAEVCEAPQRAEALVRQATEAAAGSGGRRRPVGPPGPGTPGAGLLRARGAQRLPGRAESAGEGDGAGTGSDSGLTLFLGVPGLPGACRRTRSDDAFPRPGHEVTPGCAPPGGTHPQGTAIGAPPLIRAAPRGVKVCRTELP